MIKKIIFTLIFWHFAPTFGYCGVTEAVNDFLGNEKTLKYGFIGSGIIHAYADARHDAEMFTIGKDGRNWHVYKNVARLMQLTAGATLFSAKALGYISWKELLGRAFGEGCLMWVIWQLQYHKDAYGIFWDTTPSHNEHILVYTDFSLKDKFIGLGGKEVSVALTSIGLIGLGLTYNF